MKHNRLATALVVTGSVLGLAACSWFGGDENKQASTQSYGSQSYPSAPNRSTASTSNSGASGSYTGSTASSQNYGGSSSMSANVGSSRSASTRSSGSSSEIADVQTHLQQLGYYHGRIDGVWGKQSRQAMAQFQRSQGMQATGRMDDQSVQALNSGSTNSSTATGSSGISNSSSRTGSSNLNSSSNMNSSSTTTSVPKNAEGSPSNMRSNNNGNMDTQTNSNTNTNNTAR